MIIKKGDLIRTLQNKEIAQILIEKFGYELVEKTNVEKNKKNK